MTLGLSLGMPHVRTGAAAGGAAYHADAVHFDGDTKLARGANLTGVGTPDTFLFSLWYKISQSANRAVPLLFSSGPNGQADFQYGIDGTFDSIIFDGSGHSCRFDGRSVPSLITDIWAHLLFAFDRSDQNKCVMVNSGNSIDPSVTNFTMTGGIDFSSEEDFFVGDITGTQKNIDGDIADYYLAFGQWLDLTNQANVAKFIADGKPVNLGATGSTPTGTAPTVFFSGDAAGFGTNKGTGGAFTLTGALTNAATSPSD